MGQTMASNWMLYSLKTDRSKFPLESQSKVIFSKGPLGYWSSRTVMVILSAAKTQWLEPKEKGDGVGR